MTEQKAQLNQATKSQNKARKPRPETRQPRGRRVFDTTELQTFLDSLNVGVTPTIKVNGTNHPTAILAVDFGSPLSPIRLNQDQMQELTSRLRKATRDLYSNEVNVRISSDNQNGVFWSSIS